MARGFGTTYGVGATDRLTTGAVSAGVQRTIAIWTFRHGNGGGSAGRIFARGGGEGWQVSGTDLSIVRAFTTGTKSRTIALPTIDTWAHLVVADDGDPASNPTAYVNGSTVTVSGTTNGTGTPNQGAAFTIGNRSAADRAWDGMLAELAIWGRLLTADEAAALAKGYSPLFFRDALIEYIPMLRESVSRFQTAPTVDAGTQVQPHPTLILPSSRRQYGGVSAGGGITGIGGITIATPTLAASGTYVPGSITGTGALAIAAPALAASGAYTPEAITGTGALTIARPALAADGTAAPPGDITGTGGITIAVSALAGTGTYTPPAITGTGALAVAVPTLAGAGTYVPGSITGTGGLSIAAPALLASGTYTPEPITATGGIAIAKPALAGNGSSGIVEITGTGGIAIGAPATAGTGTYTPPAITGTGAIVIAKPTLRGFAVKPRSGRSRIAIKIGLMVSALKAA